MEQFSDRSNMIEEAGKNIEGLGKFADVSSPFENVDSLEPNEGDRNGLESSDVPPKDLNLDSNHVGKRKSEFVEDFPGDEVTTRSDLNYGESLKENSLDHFDRQSKSEFVEDFPGDEVSTNPEHVGNGSLDSIKFQEKTDSLLGSPKDLEQKEFEGLSEKEKAEIKETTGWSDKIVDSISSMQEANIYIDARLQEGEVNGMPALLQPDVDWEACNAPQWPGWSNVSLAEEGYSPYNSDGRAYELHHIGQKSDSPLAELTYDQHHSNGNFKVLHTFGETCVDRVQFSYERNQYWKKRSEAL